METKKTRKPGLIERAKNWWNGLTFNQQLGLTIAVWTLDGALYSGMIVSNIKDKQAKRIAAAAYDVGVQDGKIEAYKDILSDPQACMNRGMKMAQKDKNYTVKHF